MNIQELIKKINGIAIETPFANAKIVDHSELIELIKQLDEAQKVTIPQFVAEYIEFKKKYDFHVYGAMREIEDHYDKRVPEWFYEGNIETFIRAWLDGYTVEKEKRYRVKMKGHIQENILVYGYGVKRYFLSSNLVGNRRAEHTKKQLEEDGFSEVFNNPLFEVEEV